MNALCDLPVMNGGVRRWNHFWNQSTVLDDWNGRSRILSGIDRMSCLLMNHCFGLRFLHHVRGLCAANLSSSVALNTWSRCMCASAHRVSASYTCFLVIWTLKRCFNFTRKHCRSLLRCALEKKMTRYFRRTTTRNIAAVSVTSGKRKMRSPSCSGPHYFQIQIPSKICGQQ